MILKTRQFEKRKQVELVAERRWGSSFDIEGTQITTVSAVARPLGNNHYQLVEIENSKIMVWYRGRWISEREPAKESKISVGVWHPAAFDSYNEEQKAAALKAVEDAKGMSKMIARMRLVESQRPHREQKNTFTLEEAREELAKWEKRLSEDSRYVVLEPTRPAASAAPTGLRGLFSRARRLVS